MALGRSQSHDKIMENFSKADLRFMEDKLTILEVQLEHMKAYVDQKFDELENEIEELTSRINNLR